MRSRAGAAIGAVALPLGIVLGTATAAPIALMQSIDCEKCADWNKPHEPFRIYGNTYYVGVSGLSVILINTQDGLILMDGALPQSVPLVSQNLAKLGFRLEDVRFILNSHTHFDHAGGIAALQLLSGAAVAASPASARALEEGMPTADDPQFGFQDGFAQVSKVRRISDGEVLEVGKVLLTAHFTPGHTPGGTTWTWQSCEEKRCLNMVYADSLNAVSAPGFKFSMDPARVTAFERSIATVESLPCDVLLTPHPQFFDMDGKLETWRAQPSINPFIDPSACKRYVEEARVGLEARLGEELRL